VPGINTGARAVLGGVLARPSMPGARDIALATMRQVVAAEEAVRRGANPVDAIPADRPGTEQLPTPAVIRPVFRDLQAGEQLVEGLLEGMECSPKRITFTVRLSDHVAHFQTTSLDTVEFISYRTDLQGSVTCGARTPPDRVYLTFRTGDLDGTVVAIEFLPVR
jgi:hypothetical protein